MRVATKRRVEVKESTSMRVATKRRDEVKENNTSSKKVKLDNTAEENGENQSSSINDENENNSEDKTSKVKFVNVVETSGEALENLSSPAHRRSRLLKQTLSQEEDGKLAVLGERLRRPQAGKTSSEVMLDKVLYVKRRDLLSCGVVESSSPWIQLATFSEVVEQQNDPEIIENMAINEPWSKEKQEALDAEMAVKLAADLEAGEALLSTRSQEVTMARGPGRRLGEGSSGLAKAPRTSSRLRTQSDCKLFKCGGRYQEDGA